MLIYKPIEPVQRTINGCTYYRVRVRRPSLAISVEKTFKVKADALAFAAELTHKIQSNDGITSNVEKSVKFKTAIERYIQSGLKKFGNKQPMKKTSEATVLLRLETLCRDKKDDDGGGFGRVPLKKMTPIMVTTLLDDLQDRRGFGLSTRYKYESCLSLFFKWAVRQRLIGANPITANTFERVNENDQRERIYTDEEWQRLLSIADTMSGGFDGYLSLFLRIAYETGCRKSELLRLTWDDIEAVFADDKIGHSVYIAESKNGKSRTVFLSHKITPYLRQHKQAYENRSITPLIFPGKVYYTKKTRLGGGGTAFVKGPLQIKYQFDKARMLADLDKPDTRHNEVLTIHHIRHTWATRLGAAGATLTQLMSAGGWKTATQVTRYMKLQEQQAREATHLLNQGPMRSAAIVPFRRSK